MIYKNIIFALLLILNCQFSIVNCQLYSVSDYGITDDSTVVQTEKIQAVIDLAEADGGGTVVIPQGVYLSGALFFKPKTKLLLKEGARLKGSDDISDYPLIPSRMEGKSMYYYAALVNAYRVDNFEISGKGTIDGNGSKFWTAFWTHQDSMERAKKEWTNLEVHRPRLLFLWGCNNLKILDTKLHNSGFWTTHLYQCNNVLMENCDIRAPHNAPSTDGIDIDVCKDVVIRNCYIAVDDDAVCLKGGKGVFAHTLRENGMIENVLVENCTFGHAHGVLTFGSECIHARHITLRNCKVDNDCALLRLKMRGDTYQTYENIVVENITGKCGYVINMSPWTQFFDLEGADEKPKGTVRNITMSNIKVECTSFGRIRGNPEDSVSNVVFRDMEITAKTSDVISKYDDLQFENVKINGVKTQNVTSK